MIKMRPISGGVGSSLGRQVGRYLEVDRWHQCHLAAGRVINIRLNLQCSDGDLPLTLATADWPLCPYGKWHMGPVSGVSFGSHFVAWGPQYVAKFAMFWVDFLGGPWIIIDFNLYKILISYIDLLECFLGAQ